MAVDFSTADATLATLPRLAAAGVNLVVGTTGWQGQEAEIRRVVEDSKVGAVVAANFSLGANVIALVTEVGRLLADKETYGPGSTRRTTRPRSTPRRAPRSC